MVTRSEEETMKRSSVGVSRLSSLNRRLEAASDGLRYSQPWLAGVALAAVLRAEPAHDAAERLARLRVERVEELVEVDGGRRLVREAIVAPSSSGGLLFGAEVEVDVAVGHARQRRLADRRARALVQRRPAVLVDVQLEVGLAVGGERDVLDLADRRAGDLDEVALDDLGGRLEAGVDRVVGAAAAREDDDDRHAPMTTAASATILPTTLEFT